MTPSMTWSTYLDHIVRRLNIVEGQRLALRSISDKGEVANDVDLSLRVLEATARRPHYSCSHAEDIDYIFGETASHNRLYQVCCRRSIHWPSSEPKMSEKDESKKKMLVAVDVWASIGEVVAS
jgi:hypothetical protein